jgi:hypothetical protein
LCKRVKEQLEGKRKLFERGRKRKNYKEKRGKGVKREKLERVKIRK